MAKSNPHINQVPKSLVYWSVYDKKDFYDLKVGFVKSAGLI